MEFTTNTTSSASAGAEGASSVPFTWQNPVFPAPSPRARRANSDRLTGVLYSHAPRWTQGKHERILAQIKATRTDLDPSFPRPAAEPQAPAAAAYQLSELINNLAKGTKSYFDSLTAYALEQLYGPTSAAPATSGNRPEPDAQRRDFVNSLHKAGMSKDLATNILVAWTANGIPLNAQAAPTIVNLVFEFLAEDRLSSSSRALQVYYETGRGDKLMLKCYPPASEVNLRLLNDMTGIDPQHPKFEARCLLASHIAHNILGWDFIPKATMGFVGGKACVATPLIGGPTLKQAMDNSPALSYVFHGAVKDGVVHTEQWDAFFGEQLRHDYMRLLVFTVLVGDCDRHYSQLIIGADKEHGINSIKAIDWDATFGSKKTDDVLYIKKETGQPTSLWPSSLPQTICNEFGKVNEANLKEAAAIFELTDEEVAALLSRFAVIKKKLATIKKT
ncbi:MAG: hypothetical protein V4794_20185 [Pseudomonadota bacterium]